MTLNVKAILQPQWPKVVLGQLPGEEAAGLTAELMDSFVHHPLVDFIVEVHEQVSAK
jgi:hypothetical protein